MKPGYYKDIPNAAYHAGEGISKSQLDMLAKAPALLPWSKAAPEDKEKMKALDFGDAMHAVLLEPHRFENEYVVAPKFDRRSKAGKAEAEAWEAANANRVQLTAEDGRKIALMRESVMAHPDARRLLDAEGDVESSIYWEEGGVLCRCRPDKALPTHNFIVDVKTTADMAKFHFSARDYRYDVQDAYYSSGYRHHFGDHPTFIFLVVSTSISCGKYPVELLELSPEDKDNGIQLYRAELETYRQCLETNDWPGIRTLSLPKRFN
ncbi:PD-(D/E)XK nuclease-like domain-containing protein [Alcanivorax jadensis]|uniref:PD-(D/E)XK nuclease-like domain-containing protein n=1 Tax=Alcanivorax jadensis TaxID=64988 RepID=UPI00235392F8|nr:PD-(D/E)XK nuclease-like domain-containing protein [Alcanivorax jadensis]|tara:strand:+ start:414 stop:1205 length:792 start_codon:yes stop_codon:yes gene_type:complete